MPKNKTGSFDEVEKSTEIEKEVAVTPTPSKPKQEHKIISIGKGFIYMSYVIKGVEYGKSMPAEEKYKNAKVGDILYI